jgi:ribose transport system substrate-binding protein
MLETKPANIHVTMLRGQWTEDSAQRAVRSWLKLTTTQKAAIDLIGVQNDAMAIGARNAFKELTNEAEVDRWLKLPFTGCDGLPKTGQAWVKDGTLAATIFVPPNAGQAIEMLVGTIRQRKPVPERALIEPVSIPALADLKPSRH